MRRTRPRESMTLRTRLTLWQTSLLVLLLTAFAIVSYRALDSGLRAEMDRALRERADHAALAVQVISNLSMGDVSPGLSGEFASPGIYVQVLDESGRILARSASLGTDALPVHADRLAEVLAGRSFYDTESIGGQNARLFHRPIVRDDRLPRSSATPICSPGTATIQAAAPPRSPPSAPKAAALRACSAISCSPCRPMRVGVWNCARRH